MKYLNNYKLYSKINLTFHMHQLHSPPMPGASVVPTWPARGACLMLVRCLSNVHAVHVWLTHGARALRVWLAHGLLILTPRV